MICLLATSVSSCGLVCQSEGVKEETGSRDNVGERDLYMTIVYDSVVIELLTAVRKWMITYCQESGPVHRYGGEGQEPHTTAGSD